MISFKSKITQKILNYFFLNEIVELYINETARLLKEEPKNVYRILVILEKEGLLKSKFKGRERYFRVNKISPEYKSYKTIFLRTAGVDRLLKNALDGLNGLKNAYIFGSYANSSFNAQSAIDILLVGSHESLEAERTLIKLRKSLGRELNIVSMTMKELESKSGKDQFLKSIFKKKTIRLF